MIITNLENRNHFITIVILFIRSYTWHKNKGEIVDGNIVIIFSIKRLTWDWLNQTNKHFKIKYKSGLVLFRKNGKFHVEILNFFNLKLGRKSWPWVLIWCTRIFGKINDEFDWNFIDEFKIFKWIL